MNPEILVPITFFIVVMLIIRVVLAYRHKKLVLWHQTLTTAMDNGGRVETDLMRKINIAIDPQKRDLKKAILFIVIALVLGTISFTVPFQDPQGNKVFLVLSCIPLIFSVVYLGFWKFWYK